MLRILLSLLGSYKGSCCTTMMAVGYVEGRHLAELLSNGGNVLIVGNCPELMSETVNRCYEVINRSCSCITSDEFVENAVVRIGKEYGLDIGIAYTYMLHTVFLLVATGKLVLLDYTVHIVFDESSYNKTILRLAVHCLGVDVIPLLVVLYKPTFLLEFTEVVSSLLVDTRVVLACTRLEVDFGLDDMVKTHLVVACFYTGFFRVKYIVGA